MKIKTDLILKALFIAKILEKFMHNKKKEDKKNADFDQSIMILPK